jgi:hypothetical protein
MPDAQNDMMAAALEDQLNRLVFPESECPTYHLRWFGADPERPSEWTWTPRGGMQRGLHGQATAVAEIQVQGFAELLPKLLANESPPQELLAQGVVRLGGNGKDILALENLWAADEVLAERNGARARAAVSTGARRAMVAAWRAKVERGGRDIGRVLNMLEAWAEHRVSRCVLDMWTTLEFEDLPNRPWHDPSEVSFAQKFREAHASLRKEAEALASGAVFAPHYGANFSDPDEPQRNKPWGWRHFNLVEWFERKDDRCALFPVTAPLVDAARAEYAVLHAGYLILEPGAVIPPHSDAANWCLSYHFGVIVPENCFQMVSGETRFHEEGGSMLFEDCFVHMAANHGTSKRVIFNIVFANPALTAAEIDAIRALSAELPSGTLAYSK